MMNQPIRISVIALSGAIFLALWLSLLPVRALPVYPAPLAAPAVSVPAAPESRWVTNFETDETHSASIALVNNTPVTVWYGGTREGHEDVAIFFSRFDGDSWSTPSRVVDRAATERALNRFIRKVGNPALQAWPDGSLGLYFVSVSMGGWGASAINYMESADMGASWSDPVRLVTSPFLNISTLVRTRGVPLQDGTLQLPIYHEFAGKFAETLHLSRRQEVLDKTRISRGKHSLQPAFTDAFFLAFDAFIDFHRCSSFF